MRMRGFEDAIAPWSNPQILNPRILTMPPIVYISSEQYPHHNTDTQQIVKNSTALHEAGLDIELLIPVQYRRIIKPGYDTQAEMRKFYNVGNGLKITELWGFPATPLRLEKFFHSFFAPLYVLIKRPGSIIYTRNKRVAILAFILGKKSCLKHTASSAIYSHGRCGFWQNLRITPN